MGNRILCCIAIFFLLFILFFPLDFLGDFQKNISLFLFEDFIRIFTDFVLTTDKVRIDLSSDSISMFILTGLLAITSLILSFLIRKKHHPVVLAFSKEAVSLYLIIVLVKYGLDKIFKAQFYLPEPNILYSRFGNLDRDILFWSTMGASHFYSVFTGILELCAAVLIFFNRTRMLGLLFSLGIFLNILGINLGFDISVKLFSLMLLSMTVFALKDDWKTLYEFFILKKDMPRKGIVKDNLNKPFMAWFKTAFLGLSLVIIIFPYMSSGNYNDDIAKRPFLHGAFRNENENSEIRYIFFHRHRYVIFMDRNENMRDYHYTAVSPGHLLLEDYNGEKINAEVIYSKKDSLLMLNIRENKIRARELNWKKMNALRPLFHTTIESAD
ncbi:hypothetical protein [Chryseobacterium sp.]|uniref:hypothetical protein n=1 Tax=Chryseobacterium sp. TaxID=1871047 RepID=UPI0028A2801A|nr:hypothetical protein [Chryseobacterium sp.]